MKPLLTLLLAAITATAYADNNHKADKVKPAQAVPQPATDTAWHGTGTHNDYGQRELDPRLGRSMYVAPAPPAKQ
jgi:hypothetical protein